MPTYPYAAGLVSCRQITSLAGKALPLIPGGDDRITNRILLMATGGTTIFLGGPDVSTTIGAQLPTASYLEIWTLDPEDLFVIGAGVVFMVMEEAVEVTY